jgi:hypothetical protein
LQFSLEARCLSWGVLSGTQFNNREFGTDFDVEAITGRKRKTLQKDRSAGRGFPFYRVGRKILYDLQEIRALIRAGRVDARNSGSAA